MKANTGLKEAHRAYKIFFNKSLYSSSSYFSLCRWSATSAMWLLEIVRYKRSCIVWLSSIIAAFSSSVFLSSVKDYVCTSWFDVTRHIGTFNSNVNVWSLFCGGFDFSRWAGEQHGQPCWWLDPQQNLGVVDRPRTENCCCHLVQSGRSRPSDTRLRRTHHYPAHKLITFAFMRQCLIETSGKWFYDQVLLDVQGGHEDLLG